MQIREIFDNNRLRFRSNNNKQWIPDNDFQYQITTDSTDNGNQITIDSTDNDFQIIQMLVPKFSPEMRQRKMEQKQTNRCITEVATDSGEIGTEVLGQ